MRLIIRQLTEKDYKPYRQLFDEACCEYLEDLRQNNPQQYRKELTGETTTLESVTVTVQTSPLVYLVWAGIALMVLGISVQLIADLAHKEKVTQAKS